MGALHEGHLSLLEAAQRTTDCTVCSIFVNPTQFNNSTDLAKYPRTLEADRALLEAAGCDVLFCPDEQEIYPDQGLLRLDFGPLEQRMEGAYRPGHFHGVGLVVAKLLHKVSPDKAFFGQKDLQQFRIVAQLVRDLSFDVQLEMVPIQREAHGLAMSSRNRRLTPEQRHEAGQLYATLQRAAARVFELPLPQLHRMVEEQLSASPSIRLEYFEVVDAHTLEPVQDVHQAEALALCLAAYVGEVRLIDNVLMEEK